MISRRIVFLFMLFLILDCNEIFSQTGKTCPPCAKEKKTLDIAIEKRKEALRKYNEAVKKLKTARSQLVKALRYVRITRVAMNIACSLKPFNNNNCLAAKLIYKGALYLLKKRNEQARAALKNLKDAKAKLKTCRQAVKKAETLYKACMQRPKDPTCKKCVKGKVVNKEWEEPGTCRYCKLGKLVYKCKSNEQCCDGKCKPKIDLYWTVMVVQNCDGIEVLKFWSITCFPGFWGNLERSKGGCRGANFWTVCAGPFHPCDPGEY